MKKLAFLFAIILLTVPGISVGMEGIITGPEWESLFVDIDADDPFDSSDDDLSFTPAEMESGQASPSMTITSATVTFDPKKKDKFVLKGTTGSLSLNGATSVIFEAGSFKQEITLDKFTKSKEKYTFKGATGGAGIASLILDMPKGQFSATVQNLFLTGFTNPLPVSLKAGTTAGCSMAQFSVNKNKWTFSGSRNPQYACLIAQIPQATPKGLFVNKARDIRVQVQVPSYPDLNQNTIGLFHVDSNLNLLSGSLCSLLDNGNPSNGDQTAGDRIFSCFANLQAGTAGKMVLMVGAELGGEITYSPSFTLDVVTPYTEQEAQQTITAQENTGKTWQDNLTKYGDTKKARDETVKAVKKLEGVKDAGASSDGVNIWVEFKSGIRGGIILSPEASGNETNSFPTGYSKGYDRLTAVAFTPLMKDLPEEAGGENKIYRRVANKRVLIWAPDRYDIPGDEDPQELAALFEGRSLGGKNPVKPKVFEVEFITGERANTWDLRSLTGYGTVFLLSHFAGRGKNSWCIVTREKMTLDILRSEGFMLEFLTGCLEIWNIKTDGKNIPFLAITPNFIATLEGDFKDNIVYIKSPNSSVFQKSFLEKKTHSFFGFTGRSIEFIPFATLFTSMICEGKNTNEAYAALPKLSEGGSDFKLFTGSEDELVYRKKGCYLLEWVDTDFPPSAYPPPYRSIDHYWNANVLHYKVDAEGGDQDLFVDINSYSSDSSDNEWSVQAKGLRDLAKQQGAELLRNNDDYVVPGYQSTHKDGGYSPGTWALKFHKGNIIQVMSGRCYVVYNGNRYDTNCTDSRIPGISKEQLLARYDLEVQTAISIINAKCEQTDCSD